MYADQLNAPSRIMTSPWLNIAVAVVASMPISAAASGEDVEMRKRPAKATPHPPHTDDLMLSPANAEMRGVITTLVWVRKDARAAGL